MSMQATSEAQAIDEWTEPMADGRKVSYRIAGNDKAGFIYSAAMGVRSISVVATQGPLARDKVESLFARIAFAQPQRTTRRVPLPVLQASSEKGYRQPIVLRHCVSGNWNGAKLCFRLGVICPSWSLHMVGLVRHSSRRPAIRSHHSLLRLFGAGAVSVRARRDGLLGGILEPYGSDDHRPHRGA